MHIMHCLTVKFCAVLRRSGAARRETPVVALAIVELMIDVSVEVIRPVIPRASADEDTAASEPLGPIVAIRSAIVRRSCIPESQSAFYILTGHLHVLLGDPTADGPVNKRNLSTGENGEFGAPERRQGEVGDPTRRKLSDSRRNAKTATHANYFAYSRGFERNRCCQ